MVDELMRDFAVSGAILGNLSAVYFYVYAGIQMPVGMALDRWGPRRVLAVAALVAGVGAALFAAAPNVGIAYLGRELIGGGCAFGLVGSMVLAANWFPPRRFALLSGLAMGFGFVGGISGQAPMALLVGAEGWRVGMGLLAAGALVLSLATWLITRDRPSDARPTEAPGEKPAEGAFAGLWRVARHPQTVVISIYASLISAPSLAFGGLWGVPYAMQAYGIDRPSAALAVSAILLGWAVGAPLWGWISDRTGRRKAPIVFAATLALASQLAVLYLPDLPLAWFRLLLFVNGATAASMSISYALVREHNASGNTGASLGLLNMCVVAGGALFQPLIGLLLDNAWDGRMIGGVRVYSPVAYADAFIVLPVLYALALLVALGVRETYCRPVET